MANVILQPVANKLAQEHFQKTITHTVSLKRIEPYLSNKEFEQLQRIYSDEGAFVWGVQDGKGGKNKRLWEKVKRGDVVLFSKNKKIFKKGIVTFTISNFDLAAELWSINEKNETWKNMYFVDELVNLDIEYESFNKVAGYKEGNNIQCFSYLNDEKSTRLINAFDLYSDIYVGEISIEQYANDVERLMTADSLDLPVVGTSRREQSYLRKLIFKGERTCKCGICGESYPVDLLVAAHIKRRTDCTKEERLDVEHIAMPMCKFGCDDLYEKGYILIEDGIITENKKKKNTKRVEAYLEQIKGRKCEYWNTDTEKYFEAHNKMFKD